jgi:hypothetical protein
MAGMWKLTFTDANGRVGTKTYDGESKFISGVLDKLNDLHTSNVSAVLSDGTKLDEATLRAKYVRPRRESGRLRLTLRSWLASSSATPRSRAISKWRGLLWRRGNGGGCTGCERRLHHRFAAPAPGARLPPGVQGRPFRGHGQRSSDCHWRGVFNNDVA